MPIVPDDRSSIEATAPDRNPIPAASLWVMRLLGLGVILRRNRGTAISTGVAGCGAWRLRFSGLEGGVRRDAKTLGSAAMARWGLGLGGRVRRDAATLGLVGMGRWGLVLAGRMWRDTKALGLAGMARWGFWMFRLLGLGGVVGRDAATLGLAGMGRWGLVLGGRVCRDSKTLGLAGMARRYGRMSYLLGFGEIGRGNRGIAPSAGVACRGVGRLRLLGMAGMAGGV